MNRVRDFKNLWFQLTNGKILDNSAVYVQFARPRLCLKTWSAFQSAHNQCTNRREDKIFHVAHSSTDAPIGEGNVNNMPCSRESQVSYVITGRSN